MSVEDLQYRQTGETYGEYIKRLEDIIYNWHARYTELSFELKENLGQLKDLQKKYLKEFEACDPQSLESHFLHGRCGAILDVMRIMTVGTKVSQGNGEKRKEK